MKILPRYFLKELLFPFGVSLGLICFLMIMNRLIILVDLVLQHGVGLDVVARLLFYILPATFAIAIPMSLLISILTALGRLSADSELTAMRAGGVGLQSLFWPTLLLSMVMSVGMLGFNEYVLPRANLAYKVLFFKIVSQRSNVVVRENTYVDDFENMVIHVKSKDPDTERLEDVTLFRFPGEQTHLPNAELQVISAAWGRLVSDKESWRVYLELNDGTVHNSRLDKPQELTRMAFKTGQVDFDIKDGLKQVQGVNKKPQEMSIREMNAILAKAPPQDPRHRKWGIHLHKKIAVAFACLAFAIIAFPLGCTVKKGGRLIGFAWSLGLIFFYYLLLTFGDSQGGDGAMPVWLSQWMANFFMFTVGLVLFYFVTGSQNKARVVKS